MQSKAIQQVRYIFKNNIGPKGESTQGPKLFGGASFYGV